MNTTSRSMKQHPSFSHRDMAFRFAGGDAVSFMGLADDPRLSEVEGFDDLKKLVKTLVPHVKENRNVLAVYSDLCVAFGDFRNELSGFSGTLTGGLAEYVVFQPHGNCDRKQLSKYLADRDAVIIDDAGLALVPPSHRVTKAQEWAQEAITAGYREPDTFPTSETLTKHQKAAAVTLAHRGTMMLCDEVGLGKTASFIGGALSQVQYKREHGTPEHQMWPYVIVTKKSLIPSVCDEITMWNNDAVVEVLTGRKSDMIRGDAEFIVLNADILTHRIGDILNCDPKGVVYDEAHLMKNPGVKRTRAAMRLTRHILKNQQHPYLVCATATPIPNRPEELWSQMELSGTSHYVISEAKRHLDLGKKILRRCKTKMQNGQYTTVNNRTYFDVRYCDGKATPMGWIRSGSSNAEELGRVLREHVMIRRDKSDVMFPTPPLIQTNLNIVLNDDEWEQYAEIESNFTSYVRGKLLEKSNGDHVNYQLDVARAMKSINKAEAIMRINAARHEVAELKVPHLVRWLVEFCKGNEVITGGDPTRRKIIVFAYHRDIQKALYKAPELQKYGVLGIFSGSKKVDDIVDKFQDPDGPQILVCYPGAREGLTLTAAKDVLVAEIPFMPDWVIQMAGRCWARLSRDYAPHEAYVHYAVAGYTIDEYLKQTVIWKDELVRSIINATPEKRVSVDDSDGVDMIMKGMMLDIMENN